MSEFVLAAKRRAGLQIGSVSISVDSLFYNFQQRSPLSRFTLPEKLWTCHFAEQNYPNPFNPLTYIGFHLLKPEYIKIEIYNLLG